MKTFEQMMNECVKKLGVDDLKDMLLDFGFVRDINSNYETGIKLKLPGNSFGMCMSVYIDMRGFVDVKYYDSGYVPEDFRYLLDADSVEFIFNEVYNF